MAQIDSSYVLDLGIRESYIYAGILPVPSDRASTELTGALAVDVPPNVRRRVMIESYLDEPITVWAALPVVISLMKVGCECLEIAVVDPRVPADTERDLKVHLGDGQPLTVRVFESAPDAERWFAEIE
jgi:hypothetical protein